MYQTKTLDHGIKIFYDIFSEEERLKILNQFKDYLRLDETRPGMQSDSILHLVCKKNPTLFNPFTKIKNIVSKKSIHGSWINYCDEKITGESGWHSHSNFSCVYMIENPENHGTWFHVNDQIIKTECPTNSLLAFPKNIVHSPPHNTKKPRYVLVIDFKSIQYS
tara:strand:- start:52 stop:543 length:492 start_codon:yes stop_codon:yes gene_type:complete